MLRPDRLGSMRWMPEDGLGARSICGHRALFRGFAGLKLTGFAGDFNHFRTRQK
jgi:hypothetical protein